MEAEYPRTYTYAMAIATLLLGSKGENEKLAYEKFEALRKTASLLESYASRSFDERLLDVIMEKKAKMILEATKVSDVREIATPKAPEFLGDGWSVSRFSVPSSSSVSTFSRALVLASCSTRNSPSVLVETTPMESLGSLLRLAGAGLCKERV